ncbi:MAG: methylated-DNA--[protein]-cysteine S-methyltransferase [Ferroplasma sp.]|uniref:methylated-DNA--[protein]-cysteine S-methyltransferase n=1 Tax=Ferroplasma sp. TaxID=2591003 RepID=UPI0028151C37|nr:methylated-DNA--[protein]-cysteine S-methyltransferase [Ferroplasma sp.]WMT50548.1 MAG: methylated-DNA--[protein]-cysteine S-methyltransferase [Ferroplasma sp.]
MSGAAGEKFHKDTIITHRCDSYKSLTETSQIQSGIRTVKYGGDGKGVEIKYRIFASKIDKILLAKTDRGVCSIIIGADEELLYGSLQKQFPHATLTESAGMQPEIDSINHYLDGGLLDMPVDICGTEFQVKVWTAINAIPYGETKSYSELAEEIGMPTAYRAVANACGANPVPLIIPCHRVVGKNGSLGGYGPGIDKKKFLLELEKKNKDSNKGN